MTQPETIEDARDIIEKQAADLAAIRDAARALFNALGRYATETEKDAARALYFDKVNN